MIGERYCFVANIIKNIATNFGNIAKPRLSSPTPPAPSHRQARTALLAGIAGLVSVNDAAGQERLGPISTERQLAHATDTGAEETPDRQDWSGSLSIGGAFAPDYPGSDDYGPVPLPQVELSYRDLLFLSGPSLGADLLALSPWPDHDLQAGPIIRLEFGRDEDDNDALDRLGDVDESVEAGAFMRYEIGGWSAELTVAKDIANGHEGTIAEIGAGYGFPITERIHAGMEVSATWVDDNYMQAYFGITPTQAARSGRQQYDASSGFKDAGFFVMFSYALTPQWAVSSLAGYTRLLGDAADSPLVEDGGSADQFMGGLILSYRF
ncbi:MipA/OmpV family protein [Rhodospirillaceae bacterium SYSU D60014]|uniref:MipA/OmpV family protein n=1 Tax=Virgifigura deserti TaxID=2268457 RepID=UPI000E667DAF